MFTETLVRVGRLGAVLAFLLGGGVGFSVCLSAPASAAGLSSTGAAGAGLSAVEYQCEAILENLGTGVFLPAEDLPYPSPSASLTSEDSNPDDLHQWFSASGLSVVRSHASVDLPDVASKDYSSLVLGSAISVGQMTIRGQLVAGGLWAAPIYLQGAPIGVLAVEFSEGISHVEAVIASPKLADALLREGRDGHVILEPQMGDSSKLGAWFWFSDDEHVLALDPGAEDILAGPVSRTQFLSLRESLIASGNEHKSTNRDSHPASSHSSTVGIAALILAGFLTLLGIVVWLRHESEEEWNPHVGSDLERTSLADVRGEAIGKKKISRGRSHVDDVQILTTPSTRYSRGQEPRQIEDKEDAL